MNDPEKEYQLIFERLRDICQKRKVTNYSLAKLTNLSNSSVSNLMRGKTKPYLYTMLLICAALDIHMIELFGDKEKRKYRGTAYHTGVSNDATRKEADGKNLH